MDVVAEGFTKKQYSFIFNGSAFVWRRTHDKVLGASRWGSGDFKLVDGQGRVLAVWVTDKKILGRRVVGRVHWFVNLGRELELLSLVVVLGVGEKVRRDSHAAAAGGAGGGGGGGG